MKKRIAQTLSLLVAVPSAVLVGLAVSVALLPFFFVLSLLMILMIPYALAEAVVEKILGLPCRQWKAVGDARVRTNHQGAIMPKDQPKPPEPEESACDTCRKRAADLLELRADRVKVVSLGAAFCQECGARYRAFAEASDDA